MVKMVEYNPHLPHEIQKNIVHVGEEVKKKKKKVEQDGNNGSELED